MLLSAVIHFSRLSKEKKLAEVMALDFFFARFCVYQDPNHRWFNSSLMRSLGEQSIVFRTSILHKQNR